MRLRIPAGLVSLALGIAACGGPPFSPSVIPTPDQTPTPTTDADLTIGFQRDAGLIEGRLLGAPMGSRVQVAPAGRQPRADAEVDRNGGFSLDLGAEALRGAQPLTLTLKLPGREDRVLERTVPNLRVSLHPGDVTGGMAPSASLSLTLRSAELQVLGRGSAFSGETGRFAAWILDAYGRRLRPAPGQRLRVDDGATTIDLLIPGLEADWDIESGHISGRGQPGDAIEIVLWNPWRPGETETLATDVASDGQWSIRPDYGLHPASHFYVTERLPQGDQLYYCQQIPMLYVSPGSAWVEVQTLWETEASLELWRAGRRVGVAQGGGAWSGNLQLLMRDPVGQSLPLAPGDTLHGELGGKPIELEVGPLTAEIDARAGRIVGRAPPGTRLGLARPEQPLDRTAVADTDGRFSLEAGDLLASDGVEPGEALELFYMTPGGHTMRQRFVGLSLSAELDGRLVEGRAQPDTGVTILRTERQARHSTLATRSDATGRWSATLPLDAPALGAGDQLRVEAGGQRLSLTLPGLSAELDPASGRISGQAPPEALVDIEAYTAERQPPQRLSATADAQGRWAVDLQDRGLGLPGVEALRVQRFAIVWRDGASALRLALDGPASLGLTR